MVAEKIFSENLQKGVDNGTGMCYGVARNGANTPQQSAAPWQYPREKGYIVAYNHARQELLNENSKALRFLHDTHGYDFEKDHILLSLPGKFTYNTVQKAVCQHLPAGDISTAYAITLMVKPTADFIFPDKLFYVRIRGERFDAERQTGANYWDYSVDYAYGVGHFEDIRKNYTERVFIIAQRKDRMAQPKSPKVLDFSARYLHLSGKKDRLCGDGKGKHWIEGITIRHTDGSAVITEYKPYKHVYHRYEERTDDLRAIIDKSGYLVFQRRADLKRRADALRAERKKAEADATDFTAENARIARHICECKLLISDAVLHIETAEDVRKADRALSDLYLLVDRYETHKQRVADRKYRCLQDARSCIARMDETVEAIKAQLQ